jgi:phage-related protein
MQRTGLTTRHWLATLALGTLVWGAPAGAQTQSTNPQDRDSDLTRQQLSTFDQFLDNHSEIASQLRDNPNLIKNEEFVENHPELQAYLQQHPEVREELSQNPNVVMRQEQRFDRQEDRSHDRDRDMTQAELGRMDSFMDSHPEIAEQLRKNPALVNNKEFVEDHPALQQFLAQHQGVRDEIRENPNAFMSAERRYDRREDMRVMSNMDHFMDAHPEIAEQLQKNPSLVNNKEFIEGHPALQQFLKDHPELRQQYQANPNAFMHQEERFDQREDARQRGDSDVTRGELANMDHFLDGHPEISEQLRKNPSLVDDKEFVKNHPALQQFLASHPGMREEYKENPNGFMNREQSYDRRENAGFGGDHDVTKGELSSFHEFLEGHGSISSELSKNPSLATNEEYLENHSALQSYLKANPHVGEELKENPQAFVKSAQSFDTASSTAMSSKGTMKLPTTEPKK